MYLGPYEFVPVCNNGKRLADTPVNARARFAHVALAVVVCAALWLRFEGISWPALHPDEPKIAGWIKEVSKEGSITHRVYPNGFFMMARPVWAVTRWIDGLVDRAQYRMGPSDRYSPDEPSALMFARLFNVWLGALTCLPVYWLAVRVSGSRWAGVAAAAFMAFSPQHIEHSHYAETDIAMVFTLAISLWLWVRYGMNRTAGAFVLAALATGFAAGTKFTLFALVPIFLLHAVFMPPLSDRRRPWAGRAAGWLAGGLVLCAAGFALANPGLQRFGWWMAGLRAGAASVYAETRGIMGSAYGDPVASFLKNARLMRHEFVVMGIGWLLLAAPALWLAVRRPVRKHALALLVFPAVFAFYCLRVAPWIRPQEVMTFQPVMAAAVAITLAGAAQWAWCRSGWLWRVAPPALAAVALLPTVANGLQRGSLFNWTESRLAAQQWLATCAPYERVLGIEKYTSPLGNSMAESRNVYKMEKAGMEGVRAKGCDYVIRNRRATGRGVMDPRTGLPFVEYVPGYEEFLRHSQLLRTWSPLDGVDACGMFCGSVIQLVGTRGAVPALELGLPVTQPLLLAGNGRMTFSPVGQELGPSPGVLVDRVPREIAVGGPLTPDQPVYLILNTREREACVRIRGPGRDREVSLLPFDVCVIPLDPPRKWLRTDQYQRLVLQARAVKDITYIPCYARLVAGQRQRAAVCLQLGRPDLVAAPTPAVPDTEAAGAFRAAVDGGDWALADRLRPSAEACMGRVNDYLAGRVSSAAMAGVDVFYHDEFARSRLQPVLETRTLTLRESDGGEEAPGRGLPYSLRMPLPFCLPAGRYRLDLLVSLTDPKASGRLEITDERRRVLTTAALSDMAGRCLALSVPIEGGGERQPALVLASDSRINLLVHLSELRWSAMELVQDQAGWLAAALARYDLEKGNPDDAGARLAGMKAEGAPAAEILRLRFQTAVRRSGMDSTNAVEAARALLAVAPRHAGALQCLARVDPRRADEAAAVAGNLPAPVVFGRQMAVVGFRHKPEKTSSVVVVEALQDHCPALAIAQYHKNGRKWKRIGAQPVGREMDLLAGERVRVQIKWPPGTMGLESLALGVEADAEWNPGRLPLQDSGKHCISLTQLRQLQTAE